MSEGLSRIQRLARGLLNWPKKLPCVLAIESQDCGPAALATVALHYGLHISVPKLRELLGTDLQGTDLVSLQRGAEELGFSATAGRTKPGVLDQIPLPAVAHLQYSNSDHMVVIHKINEKSVVIADPALGIVTLARKEFLRRWSTYVLLLAPGPTFKANKKPKSTFFDLIEIAMGQSRLVAVSVVLAVTSILLGFGLSFAVGILLDRVISRSETRWLYLIATGICVLVIFRSLSTLSHQYLQGRVGSKIEISQGLRYTRRILSFPVQFFEKKSVGDVIARISDIASIRAAISASMMAVVLSIMFFVVFVVCAMWYNTALACVAAVYGIIIILITRMWSGRLLRKEREEREYLTQLTRQFIEIVASMRVVKAFTSELKAFNKISKVYVLAQRATMRRLALSQMLGATLSFGTGTAMGALLVTGVLLVMGHRLSIGQLMFLYSAAGLCMGAIEQVGPAVSRIQEAMIGVERLNAISLLDPEDDPKINKLWKGPLRGEVELRDVAFWHRLGHPVLSHINLHIVPGEYTAILGETGSGKTTLAYIIAGLYPVKEGQVFIDGACLRDCDKRSLRRQIGIVFQEPGLMRGSIRENIALGAPDASRAEIEEAAKIAGAHEFILGLPRGYEYDVGPWGIAVSSGQRQRLAIARAVLRDSGILILDEATSNLDSETERQVMRAIQTVRQNRTTIIITHRLTTAIRADRIVILSRGSVVEVGTHEHLIRRKGKYYTMWNAIVPNPGEISQAVRTHALSDPEVGSRGQDDNRWSSLR